MKTLCLPPEEVNDMSYGKEINYGQHTGCIMNCSVLVQERATLPLLGQLKLGQSYVWIKIHVESNALRQPNRTRQTCMASINGKN